MATLKCGNLQPAVPMHQERRHLQIALHCSDGAVGIEAGTVKSADGGACH
jgi:hypothetical protein